MIYAVDIQFAGFVLLRFSHQQQEQHDDDSWIIMKIYNRQGWVMIIGRPVSKQVR